MTQLKTKKKEAKHRRSTHIKQSTAQSTKNSPAKMNIAEKNHRKKFALCLRKIAKMIFKHSTSAAAGPGGQPHQQRKLR